MHNLLQLNYWFNPLPGAWLGWPLKIITALAMFLILIGLMGWLFVGKNRSNKLMAKLWHKVQFFGLTIGISIAFLVFARQEDIYFLGMPILLLLVFLWAAVWLYYIINYIIVELPQKKKEIDSQRLKEKYLPK